MSRIRISHRAQADLDEIWLHIAESNPKAADRLTAKIVEKYQTLLRFPEMGSLGWAWITSPDSSVFLPPGTSLLDLTRWGSLASAKTNMQGRRFPLPERIHSAVRW